MSDPTHKSNSHQIFTSQIRNGHLCENVGIANGIVQELPGIRHIAEEYFG